MVACVAGTVIRGAGSIGTDAKRLFWPGSSVQVEVTVPRNVILPSASRGVMCIVIAPTVTFAVPGRVGVSAGNAPVITTVIEPNAGTRVLGTLLFALTGTSPWGAVTVTDASPSPLAEAMPRYACAAST